MGKGATYENFYPKISRKSFRKLIEVVSTLNELNVNILNTPKHVVKSVIMEKCNLSERSALDYYYTIVLLKTLL